VSHSTIWRILKKEGVVLRAKGRQASSVHQYGHSGCVGQWILDHPKKALPTNRHKVSVATGCSLGAVDNYLSRRRRKAANLRKDLPDLRKEKLVLCTDEGFYFASGALGEIKVHIHPLSFVVFINGVLHTGEQVALQIPLEKLWERIMEGRGK